MTKGIIVAFGLTNLNYFPWNYWPRLSNWRTAALIAESIGEPQKVQQWRCSTAIALRFHWPLTAVLLRCWCQTAEPLAISNIQVLRWQRPKWLWPVWPLQSKVHKTPNSPWLRCRRCRKMRPFHAEIARKGNFHLPFDHQHSPTIIIITVRNAHHLILTSNKKAPNVRQNTNGPAISVSCNMFWSVVRNGFSTERVWKEGERERIILAFALVRIGGVREFNHSWFWYFRNSSRLTWPGLAIELMWIEFVEKFNENAMHLGITGHRIEFSICQLNHQW